MSWIVNALRSDETVVAAWLGGSFGRGNADDLSDIDLWVVVEDDQINAIAAAPSAFVRALVRTIMEIEAPGNAPSSGCWSTARRRLSTIGHVRRFPTPFQQPATTSWRGLAHRSVDSPHS